MENGTGEGGNGNRLDRILSSLLALVLLNLGWIVAVSALLCLARLC